MSNRDRCIILAIGFVLGAALGWIVLRGPDSPRPSALPTTAPALPPRPDDYVGSEACAACHQDLYDSYRRHPMANSLAPIAAAEVIETYAAPGNGAPAEAAPVSFRPASQLEYRVERSADEVRHRELRWTAEGELLLEQAVPIHYVVGSGRHGRSYLTERDGLLYVSPISWYTKTQRWDLSPGYRPQSHPRFERLATDPCLQCHAGRLAAPREEFQTAGNLLPKYQSPVFLEHGVGCERCHGPGGRHVAYHAEGLGEDAIVNPQALDPARRESVCNQCHLHGEHRSLRAGRGDRDFRPGDHLNEIWTVWVKGDDDTDASHSVSHVEQMRSSRCYQADPNRFSCVSCHDPHAPAPPDKAAYYRERCLSCHAAAGCSEAAPAREAAGDACTTCHMPRAATEDVPHTTQTDHRILRRPAEPAGEHAPGSPEQWMVFDAAAWEVPPLDRDRALGLALSDHATWSGERGLAERAVRLLGPVLERTPRDAAAWHAAGAAHLAADQPESAADCWRQALKLDPRRQDTLYSLGVRLLASGQTTEAESVLGRLAGLNPFRADVRRLHSEALARKGLLPDALAEAEEAIRVNPADPENRRWRIELLRQAGQAESRRTAEAFLEQLQSANSALSSDSER